MPIARSSLPVCFAALACGALVARAAIADTVTWTGGGDGTSWNQAANWSSFPSLPNSESDVIIPAGDQSIVFDAIPVEAVIRSLSLDRSMTFASSCRSLRVAHGIVLPTSAGMITTPITPGPMSCENLKLDGSQSITGLGTIVLGSGVLRVMSPSQLTIGPGITVTNLPNANGRIDLDGGTVLINHGTVRASGGLLSIGGFTTVINAGRFEAVNNGRFSAGGTFTNNGELVINTGGTISLDGPLAALGTITRSGGTLILNNYYTGPTLALSEATGSMILANTILLGTTLTATDGKSFTTMGGTTLHGVTLDAPLALTDTCNALRIEAGLTLQPGATITTTSFGCNQVNFSGPSQFIGGSGEFVGNAGTFRLLAGATVTFGPGITLRNNGGDAGVIIEESATLINQGVIRSSTAGHTFVIRGNATGGPSALVNSGTIDLASGGGLALLSPISAINNGRALIDPGSVLNVGLGASFQSGWNAEIDFRIAGPGDSKIGRLAYAGDLVLGGRATVEFVDGFAPTGCQAAMTLASGPGNRSGAFAATAAPTPPGNLRSAIGYSDQLVYLAFTNRSDVVALGGAPIPDGATTADDLVAFLAAFFSGRTEIADVALPGGAFGADGLLTPDDVIAFLSAFFEGCP